MLINRELLKSITDHLHNRIVQSARKNGVRRQEDLSDKLLMLFDSQGAEESV